MRVARILFLSGFLLSPALIASVPINNECLAGDSEKEGCRETVPLLPHELDFYINGTWVPPIGSARTLEVIDPSLAEPVATISLGSQDDTDAAVLAARQALPAWSALSIKERRTCVERLLKIYRERREQMAQLISTEMGSPIDHARGGQSGSGLYHIKQSLKALKHFEQEQLVPGVDPNEATTTIILEPIGVVAMITPWNWPMNQVTLKVIPALLVGCTCVLKPSEIAPLSSLLFAEMMHEAGFPRGVFNLVHGDGKGVGTQLSSHPDVDMVSFTGSTRAGRLISQAAAASNLKKVSLELGGKGANIIFADVKDDLTDIVRDGVWSCFDNSGQSCNAPTRMLVERSLYDRAIEIAVETAKEKDMVVKSAHDEGDFYGPVVSQTQFDKVQRYIERGIEEGARLVAGGPGRPEGTNGRGYYVQPTIFADVTSSMAIMQEEIFGPVLCIMSFDTEEEAVNITNETPYGLTNYVHTKDGSRRRRLARALKSGMIEMNGVGSDDGAPFAAMRASGNGREGGVYGLQEFCVVKVVSGVD